MSDRVKDSGDDHLTSADTLGEKRVEYDADFPGGTSESRGIERDEHGFPVFVVDPDAPVVTTEMVARALEG